MRRFSAPILITAATLTFLAACASPGGVPAAPASSPTPTPTLDPIAADVEARLADMTTEQLAAQVFMLHAPGTDPAPLAALADLGIGGLILMGDNVPATPEDLAVLVDAVDGDADWPLLIGIDEEGGTVQRLPWDDAAAAPTLRDAPPAAAEEAFADRAATLAASGISVNFGIVADVTADPESFIFDRVLGTDPPAAAERVAAAVAGERGVVASTLKHFPGHGAAPGDSHTSIPAADLSLEEWRETAEVPFTAGIDAGTELVMTGHLAYPAVDAEPATFSRAWHELLRDELGFEGVVVTDDMIMLQNSGLPEYRDPVENAVRAVAAGSDLLLYVLPANPADVGIDPSGLIDGIVAAVDEGRIPAERLEDAARHVLTLRRTLAEG